MELILRIEQINEQDFDKIYVISDLHGNNELFDKALNQIDLHYNDLLIIAGDSCDRGFDSSAIYEKVLGLKSYYNIIHLLGNHEWMFYNYAAEHMGYELWMLNGGEKTIDSYNNHFPLMDSHIEFIRNMPVILETPKHIICHAGVNPEIPLEMESLYNCIWYSEEELNSYFFTKTLVSGHHITPKGEIEFKTNNRIAIDCGSYIYHRLGILELKSYRTMYIT